MPLGTTWKDIGSLLYYGFLLAGAFFAVIVFHLFIAPLLPIPARLRYAADFLLVIAYNVAIRWVRDLAVSKAAPNPYRRSKHSAQ
jgi:CBS domain containing-hemolysin-like protein